MCGVHCPLEMYVNRNCQIGLHAQAPGGHVPQWRIAGDNSDSGVTRAGAPSTPQECE